MEMHFQETCTGTKIRVNFSENSETKWLPDGFHFLGPTESAKRRNLLDPIHKYLIESGYSEVTLPAMDYSASFTNLLNTEDSQSILRFRDLQGKEISPSTDLTLQVVKGMAGLTHLSENQKVYYTAKRIKDHKKRNASRREVLQVGAERIGRSSVQDISEILSEADEILKIANPKYRPTIVLGHNSLIRSILSNVTLNSNEKSQLTALVHSKNIPVIKAFCNMKKISKEISEILIETIMQVDFTLMKRNLQSQKLSFSFNTDMFLSYFQEVIDSWNSKERFSDLCVDFSIVRDLNYYTGFLFQGFIHSESEAVLNGGQYDHLYEIYGSEQKAACGYAIQIDTLEAFLN
jgi:ATP phosphoribosyltransferase regulatory subunit